MSPSQPLSMHIDLSPKTYFSAQSPHTPQLSGPGIVSASSGSYPLSKMQPFAPHRLQVSFLEWFSVHLKK